MSKGNKIALFCTGLVGILSLSACAPSVSIGEARDLLIKFEDMHRNFEVGLQTQFHFQTAHKKTIKRGNSKEVKELNINTIYDTENYLYYASVDSTQSTSYKQWVYQEGNWFYNILETPTSKIYEKKYNVYHGIYIPVFYAARLGSFFFGKYGLKKVDDLIDHYEYLEEEISSKYGDDTTLAKELDCRSNLSTYLNFYAEAYYEHATVANEFNNATIKVNQEVNVGDYELNYLEKTEEINGSFNNKNYYSYETSTMMLDHEFDFNFPSLDGFVEGKVVTPKVTF